MTVQKQIRVLINRTIVHLSELGLTTVVSSFHGHENARPTTKWIQAYLSSSPCQTASVPVMMSSPNFVISAVGCACSGRPGCHFSCVSS